ncbi:trypsin-like peptidase domain-containing protein [Mucilaginibacter galii]|uniref:Serine protease n=1 Tax=Mucilaginibacter galii TaxID=2005073 RepID=A0A917J7A6_9SPHI|nr:trypsin-like peptidase domain-containing protein [Mucilaginibacter galii]GGI49989.1 hypothetical protein GCM10011425_12010 [Mucilaginibacter galii]
MKFILTIWLALALSLAYSQDFTNSKPQGQVDDITYLSTVKITKSNIVKIKIKGKNKSLAKDSVISSTGTGFFVYKQFPSGDYKVFLVTNKHMVGQWSLIDTLKLDKDIKVNFYTKSKEARIEIVPLINAQGVPLSTVHAYPNQLIDIVVIDVTDFLRQSSNFNLDVYATEISLLPSLMNLSGFNIFTGDQVFVIGYPAGIGTVTLSMPLIKSAVISSPMVNTLDLPIMLANNQTTSIYGKLILLDGYIVGGNSGGPVVVPRRRYPEDKSNIHNEKNRIIGIVSSVYTNTGLTIVYAADYIKDLVNKYSQ